MNDLALSSIELCAGVGMLGEGVRAALDFLGIGHRTVCYVEREASAAAQLAALMEAGALDPAPVWSDLVTFRGGDWRGKVDCVIAGFPCQDISIAGRRAGLDGKRSGLFFNILDIADACGAWCLALENVSAIATATASVVDEEEGELDERAAARVLGELADRGWDAEWITLSASDVGASHGRARWFCFAWRRDMADAGRSPARWSEPEPVGRRGGAAEYLAEGAAVADAARDGHDGPLREAGRRRGVRAAGNALAHAERAERRPECLCGNGCIQGHDRGRREADGGAGVADAALDLATSHGRHQWRAEPGREQGRPDAAECGCAVADTPDDLGRRGERRAQAGTGSCECGRRGLASGCDELADASSTRLQGREQCRTRTANRGGAGSTWTS